MVNVYAVLGVMLIMMAFAVGSFKWIRGLAVYLLTYVLLIVVTIYSIQQGLFIEEVGGLFQLFVLMFFTMLFFMKIPKQRRHRR